MDRLSHSATTLPMELNLSQFCQKFQLDNEIQQLLAQHGFDTVQSVLEAVDGGNLDFKIGHIAEITWALNKLEVERTVNAEGSTNTAPGSSAPTLTGGRGGTGGNSPLNPGAGGVGQGPQISLHDVHGFSVISGGTGGTGGASGVPPGAGRAKETSLTAGSVPYAGSTLSGGWGGAGGYSPQIGGPGGHGEGPQIPGQNVAYFREITGEP
ncbi:hypothetical protein C8R45DRAFT_1097794 [Mycena sanguinolenta]|nr:hypothetical protein C8R45DRAFT_1097794 [Mycena sanguinolenta]